MTITLFVDSDCLLMFLEITKTLKDLPLDNSYNFDPRCMKFSEQQIDIYNYMRINMDVSEYLKLKYCIKIRNRDINRPVL